MIRRRCILDVRGRSHTWGIEFFANDDQIKRMRDDGLDVCTLENSMPEWVFDIGLARAWCFVEDVWNFRNPFRS